MTPRKAASLLLPPGPLRWQLGRLGLLTALMALLEAAGVGSIAPLVLVLQSPESFAASRVGAGLAAVAGTTNPVNFVPLAVGAVALLFAAKAGVTLAQGYATQRFAQALYAEISKRILAGYLAMPFARYAAMNSAVLQRNVTTETRQIVDSIVLQAITAVSECLVVALILAVLVWLNPVVALGAFGVGAMALLAGGLVIRRIGAREGLLREETQAAMLKIAQSALAGIREVKIAGAEAVFLERFAATAARHGRALAMIGWIQVVPRVVLESIAILIVCGVFAHAVMTGTATATLPLLAVYLAAGYRLLPSINRLYISVLAMTYSWSALRAVGPALLEAVEASAAPASQGLPAEGQTLIAERVSFSYPGVEGAALRQASLSVSRGEIVGLVGASGAGKSTLVNILTGLLAPESGRVTLDGVTVADETARARLRATVAYVTQSTFIADDTLRANIALGSPAGAVDADRLRRAVAIAQLDPLVSFLPAGLDTHVGERGARLSGGEAQRIGIARALYLDRPIIVLDEASSALDPETERRLIAALRSLRARHAVITISHRPQTLVGCDRVYRLERGLLREVTE